MSTESMFTSSWINCSRQIGHRWLDCKRHLTNHAENWWLKCKLSYHQYQLTVICIWGDLHFFTVSHICMNSLFRNDFIIRNNFDPMKKIFFLSNCNSRIYDLVLIKPDTHIRRRRRLTADILFDIWRVSRASLNYTYYLQTGKVCGQSLSQSRMMTCWIMKTAMTRDENKKRFFVL